MRIIAIAALLLVASCGKSQPEEGRGVAQGGSGAEKIACAVEGASTFEPVCAVDRMSGPDGLVLTVRHPGGGFRRLQVTTDGRGVVPADGAESATIAILQDRLIEVAIGTDRYRLPATVRK